MEARKTSWSTLFIISAIPMSAMAQTVETSSTGTASPATTAPLPTVKRLPEADAAQSGALSTIDSQQVEDIVVTTERRSQRLQDIAAVTKAISGEALRMQGINRFTDLSNALPMLNIGNREGNVEIFIRGIGDDNNTELSEPRSATMMDGIYISRPRGLGSFFFDVDRVELNIGPQGTLRGRNATGGSDQHRFETTGVRPARRLLQRRHRQLQPARTARCDQRAAHR